MDKDEVERYARHIVLKEIGGAGQAALSQARVLLVGAGGLGGPAGLYLAAAGIGTIGIADDDEVALSNLQRQIQFGTEDIGQLKTSAMAKRLSALNPRPQILTVDQRVTSKTANEIFSGYDLILDGTDDFAARFAINFEALKLRIPLVSGALGRFDGQVSAFRNDGSGPCYRCLVPEIPPDAETCSRVGVVGALAGMIGSMMAMEAIKIITGAGTPLFGKVFVFDGLIAKARTITLPKDPQCQECSIPKNKTTQP